MPLVGHIIAQLRVDVCHHFGGGSPRTPTEQDVFGDSHIHHFLSTAVHAEGQDCIKPMSDTSARALTDDAILNLVFDPGVCLH